MINMEPIQLYIFMYNLDWFTAIMFHRNPVIVKMNWTFFCMLKFRSGIYVSYNGFFVWLYMYCYMRISRYIDEMLVTSVKFTEMWSSFDRINIPFTINQFENKDLINFHCPM